MFFKHQYVDEEERNRIIFENADKRLVEEQNIFEGNFLIFTDEKPVTEQISEIKTENAQLKQQLMQQNDDLQGFMDFYFNTLA